MPYILYLLTPDVKVLGGTVCKGFLECFPAIAEYTFQTGAQNVLVTLTNPPAAGSFTKFFQRIASKALSGVLGTL